MIYTCKFLKPSHVGFGTRYALLDTKPISLPIPPQIGYLIEVDQKRYKVINVILVAGGVEPFGDTDPDPVVEVVDEAFLQK